MRQELAGHAAAGRGYRFEYLTARHWFAEQKSLHFVAIQQPEQPRLLLGFDASATTLSFSEWAS
jgi:hypothetical protein